MSDIRIKMAKDLRDMSDMVGDLHWMAAKAVEDLTKKDGEIAKRDARIMWLESQYQRDVCGLNNEGDPIGGDTAGGYANDNARLRSELSAIKAQEPVAYIPVDRETGEEWHPVSEKGSGNICDYKPLYAAPVSEAKAQGVVQWPEADEIMQMAFEEGQPADDASGYCFELEEFDLFIERLMSDVARLNAAPAAPAADAVMVDMYRHLQTVTPYRFKKIQDASVTDGGDVLYFHKDRFDAALLDDIAAHRAKGVV